MTDFVDNLLRHHSGQTVCRKCTRSYNNRAVPEYCHDCNYFLGGQHVKSQKLKGSCDSRLITSSLASVRTNTAGIPTRTFVDLSLNQCLNPGCVNLNASLNAHQRETTNYCSHLKLAREAKAEKRYAEICSVNLEALARKISDEEIEKTLKNVAVEGEIAVYNLPGGNQAVPNIFVEDSFVHIRQGSCPLDECKHKSRSKVHTLLSKAKPLCLHTILALMAEKPETKEDPKPIKHQLDFKGTVEKVVMKIKTNFPPTFRSCEEGGFLSESKTFVDSLLLSDNAEKLSKMVPSVCDQCCCKLEVWRRKEPRSYLLTLGVCDDACTLVQHMSHRDRNVAIRAFGDYRGCFEVPSSTLKPSQGIDCPDILPLAHANNQNMVKDSMKNPSALVHPDVKGTRRYVMGTGLQMRDSGTSHKRPECSFHNVNHAKQGELIRTMNQEALQITRKYKTIQQDRLRGFATSFLANFLQDYFHNLKKTKEQEARFRKIEGFSCVERDDLTKRAVIKFREDTRDTEGLGMVGNSHRKLRLGKK